MVDAPTVAQIAAHLRYDPETGELFWKVHRQKVKPGQRAGTLDKSTGYRQVRVHGKIIYAHRLAWALYHGTMPTRRLDHKDGDRTNNRIANLRESTASQNGANAKVRKDNATGLKGVRFDKSRGKYKARLRKDGQEKFLGWFETAEEAHERYKQAAQEHHGEFARFS